MNHMQTLEFDLILNQLAALAFCDAAKARCRSLQPSLIEADVRRRTAETTVAKQILTQFGTPPLTPMAQLQSTLTLLSADAMLLPDQIAHVSAFLVSCRRMKTYLGKAEQTGADIAWYGRTLDELAELQEEIDRCIRNGSVDDNASPRLADLRRKSVFLTDQIKAKLDALLRRNKDWFSEQFVSLRNGRYTLPVRREHKKDLPGTVVDLSQSGGTCFIEPLSVGRLQAEHTQLQIEEDNEVRRILYTLTALIGSRLPELKRNIEAMESLDFLFAKGTLSLNMDASPVGLNTGRLIRLTGARHPLLDRDGAVPLDLEFGAGTAGLLVTGPNTGGKTVALKTVGLLSLMAQSGLHVPADADSSLCMHNQVLCDIGDGQSISENLSTFSSHMKNIIEILSRATEQSLVLIDELGSGTDPAEGMGLAIAVLDELRAKNCLFLITTHYPELKEYAATHPGLVNARMAFDRESLKPLYRLEVGVAGESCALHIAARLGLPQRILERAYTAAYGADGAPLDCPVTHAPLQSTPPAAPKLDLIREQQPKTQTQSLTFQVGDSVLVYPNKEIGLVYARSNNRGEIGVQVKGVKRLVGHKRLKLLVSAAELYPDDYDFSIVFDSVKNRKARHIMQKRHEAGNFVTLEEEPEESPK